jgi:pimeloyl-ACP methyl ester carboxylesterase
MPQWNDLYYQLHQKGEQPPVVLIHGAGGTHLFWPPEIRRLPAAAVYSLDLPGHGKSSGCGLQSISSNAQVLLEWVDALELNRAVFVGHSMGGAIALQFALENPTRVLGLGLFSTAARLPVNPDLMELTSTSTTYPTAVEKLISWSFSPETPERLQELAHKRMLETRATVLHGDFLACSEFDLVPRLGEISPPALVLCGAGDKMTPLRQSQFLTAELPQARLEVIEAAGHMVMLERPHAVAQVLMSFLGEITAGY